ncbi:hypothetical protein JCM6882_006736 [Rhodosporidiobolus microsporus]
MPHHLHHRPRSRSRSLSGSGSDSTASSVGRESADGGSSSASSGGGGGRRRRRRWSEKVHGKEGGSDESDTDSSASYHSSAYSSDDSTSSHHSRHHSARRKKKEKQQRERLLLAGGGLLLLVVVLGVIAYYVMNGNGDAAGGAGPATAGGAGGSSTSKASSAGGAGASSKPSSSASKTSADSSPSPSASVTGTTDGGGGAEETSSPAPSDDNNTGPHKLLSSYQGETFFDGWEFFTSADPTHGQVNYISKEAAQAANLISTTSSSAILRVDNSTTLDAGANRDSVRITSAQPMSIGSIVIADIQRMPWGCATWPAWWTVGGDWPNKGEIDILEGVHDEDTNHYTLHVKDSECKQGEVDITGAAVEANNDCNANVNGNAGCSYSEAATASYGEAFNAAGGGVFVTQFAEDGISIWFWSRPDIPDDITSGSPDNSNWGKPSAMWKKDTCDIASYFGDQTLVINTTLCGDWAGATFPQVCASAGGTCSDYVADPAHFNEAWWEVNYVKVYSISGD